MRNMKFLTAVAASLTLAGCAAGSLGTTNTSMYSVHQPVVERTNFAIDLNSDGGGISTAEQNRLGEWFDALRLGYGDSVSVDFGSSYADQSATKIVSKVASDRGVLLDGVAPVTAGQIAPGMVRVIVTRSKASVPSCPDFTTDHDRNYNASNHSNHGCSVNSNLAAMIANPEDLVRGQENKRLDTNSGKRAVDTYRAKTGGN
ncbi:MAG TPA: CpaD family pilus assembly protein [Sphingorhabdus lacus]|jgi:pilus assembly protein CpaD|nr:CpaD family pilus assembly protein [Sphingorhabdus lacus]HNW18385.1 CpaD family pilus assembly protein [Sphingorhabdus lacus]HPV67000.1 CpaD family pilus assembly protein [Sphingorhabdus lacus]